MRGIFCASLVALWLGPQSVAVGATGRLAIQVSERGTEGPIPCRLYLKDAGGKAVRAPGLPFWHDHFAGNVDLALEPGAYTFEVDRGPEYRVATGSFAIREAATETLHVRLDRITNLSAQGWWSGDLHVHRAPEDIALLMRSEDLHMAPVITWWNGRNTWAQHPVPAESRSTFDGNRFADILAGEDEREGGALLFFHLKKPLHLAGSQREYPPPMRFVEQARKQAGAWIDLEKPFWWDTPVWLAFGAVDSVEIANNHMQRSGMYPGEAWGRPRDAGRLLPPRGNGFYTQEIYYQILNCGLRIPPSAGSASGVLPNPVGYNRVYVQAGRQLSFDGWWEALRAGRSFVTNGPLLLVQANDHSPGHVFQSSSGRPMHVDLTARLISRDPVASLEIVRDGQVVSTVPASRVATNGSLVSLEFDASGWFLVRAIADVPLTFRFASTAPFYVEVGASKRRVSRSSARFFLDWVRERAGRIKLADSAQREEVLSYHRRAEDFWQKVLDSANAD